MKARKRPPALYREPDAVPISSTKEAWEAWAQRAAEPDPVGRLIDEERELLRTYLATQGIQVVDRAARFDEVRRGYTCQSVDGGFVCFRKADMHPAVIEAVDALSAVESLRRAKGERRVLAAFALGAAIERLQATAAFARVVHAYRCSHKPAVTDDQVRAAVAAYDTRAEAADELGISTRRLQDRCKELGIPTARNRKRTTSDT